MATLRIEKKLEAINRHNHEDHPRNSEAQNTNSSWKQEDYFTQVSEEFEGRVTKRLSQMFPWTKSRILGTLFQLDDFLLNPQAGVHSGSVPEASRKSKRDSQGMNEDHSQYDPYPEVGVSRSFSSQEFSPAQMSKNAIMLNKQSNSRYETCFARLNISLPKWTR